ncbi:MAG TPA: histone deacetylase [Anaerolineae bacterium]|nr:histone deacetylase [Anaerolineae bacterium]HID85025.1 histone deacetylase [Anaerolineales bacterium]HIQ08177.1 histone deacetylase [Anaerolineaceae bacterium]
MIYYHDIFTFPLPPGHRFPEVKYRLLRETLLARGMVSPEVLQVPTAATEDELALGHLSAYLEKVLRGRLTPAEERRIGLPWSPQLVERTRRSVGGTIAAAYAALEGGLGINLGGGTHHAAPDHGAGYCVFNDVVVAARVLQRAGLVRRVLVVDGDVHQGDGTAAATSNDPTIFAFSIHAEHNFPFRKVPGDLDIGLPDGTGDEAYLQALDEGLRLAFARFSPDIVFYIAGADPYEGDRLGRLSLTREGLLARDRLVMETVRRRRLPLVLTMGGGYARPILDTVEIHAQTVALALDLWGQSRKAVLGETAGRSP